MDRTTQGLEDRRKTVITASMIAGITGSISKMRKVSTEILYYETKCNVIRKIFGKEVVITNKAMQHGLDTEAEAMKKYISTTTHLEEYVSNKFIFISNINEHYNRLGCTPDLQFETYIVQIKCPYYTKEFPKEAPIYYKEQCLLELFVSNYITPKIKSIKLVYYIDGFQEVIAEYGIKEAKEWYKSVQSKLDDFYNDITKIIDDKKQVDYFVRELKKPTPRLIELLQNWKDEYGLLAEAKKNLKTQLEEYDKLIEKMQSYMLETKQEAIKWDKFKISIEKRKDSVKYKKVLDLVLETKPDLKDFINALIKNNSNDGKSFVSITKNTLTE